MVDRFIHGVNEKRISDDHLSCLAPRMQVCMIGGLMVSQSKNETLPDLSLATRLARALGILLHPLVTGFPVAMVVGIREYGGWSEVTLHLTLQVTMLCIIAPLAYLAYLVRAGHTTDIFMSLREDRRYIFPIGTLNLVITYITFRYHHASDLILNVVLAAILVMAAMQTGTLFSKPSMHTAGNAGIGAALAINEGYWTIPYMMILTAAVMWSRVRAKRHTVSEVIQGFFIGAGATTAVLLLLRGSYLE